MRIGLFVFAISICLSGQTQVHDHAIGLRGGGSSSYYGYGPEISYQLGLNDKNRIEFDLGWYHRNHWKNNNGIGWGSNAYNLMTFTAVYHWVFNITDGLNWYVGPGAQLLFYNEIYDNVNDGIYLSIGGQIGLEYDFTNLGAPLQLGLDYRPMFFFWNDNVGHGLALSLRYLIN